MGGILTVPVPLALARKVARPSTMGAYSWTSAGGGSIGRSTDLVTYGQKLEAEGEFDQVALAWENYETNAVNNCKAVLAATETFAVDTQDHRYRPVVGGVAYNTLRGSTNPYGWDAVTWGGAGTVNIPAANGVAEPKIVVSDWMPINSVPRADGGTRPLLLVRTYHDGSGDGGFTFEQLAFNTYYNAATSQNRGRLIDVSQATSDAIGTLGTSMLAGIRCALAFPIFRYRHRTTTVACVGDSISSGTGSDSGLNSWNRRACFDISTPTNPIVPMNMGCASMTSTTYMSRAKIIFDSVRPSVSFYFPYSPNDGINTQRKLQDAMARASEFVGYCQDHDIVPILATPVPKGGILLADDDLRKAFKTNILALAASRSVIVADFASVTGDGASPEQWIAGMNSDTLHPSDAGHEAMSVIAKAAILKAVRRGY